MDQFGTPVPRDPALTAKLGLDGADVVGFIGSFYDYEGLDDLIAALPRLVRARPKAKLLLVGGGPREQARSEEHTSELQSLMRISYAVFCLKKNTTTLQINRLHITY